MIRRVPGVVAPDRIVDIETRRVAQSIQARVQWMLDNWPDAVRPLAFCFSVRNYNGHVQLVGDAVPAKVRRFYGHDASGALGWFTFPDSADVKFQMSVINNSGIVTLVNDEEDPDYGQFYGVGANDTKGWQYPIEHPWRWQQKSKDSGNLTAGLVRINGVNKNHGQPASLSGFTESMRYWVEVDTTAEMATWTSGTLADNPIFPVGDDHTIIFPILTVYVETRPETIEGEEVQVPYITGFVQERWSHIGVIEYDLFDFAFRFDKTGDNGGVITEGTARINELVFADGQAQTILSHPANWTLAGIAASIKYWITVDLSSGSNIPTVTWCSGAAYTAPTDVLIVYPILEITCAGGKIVSYIQRRCADIVLHRTVGKNSVILDSGKFQLVNDEDVPADRKFYGKIGGNKGWFDPATDPADPGEYVTTIDDTVDADILKTWEVGDVNGNGVRLGLRHTKHTVPIYNVYDHKWYSYTRVETYAVDGRLFNVTVATKQTVHEPVAHSTL